VSLTELVARIRSGDRDAEAELVRRYLRGVGIIVRQSCSDRSACEDLTQDTLRIAIEKIRAGAVRDPERLSGFVASLARNLVIEHARRTKGRESAGGEDAGSIRDPAAGPLDRLLQDERDAIVRRLLDELPTERDRAILRRYYLDEQDKDEICAALGLTREHFTRVLFRARQRYRESLERQYGPALARDKRQRSIT
jgi:RNA polymerase sigma-70 factor (ECF subfamily)